MRFLVGLFSLLITLAVIPWLFMVCFNAVVPSYFGVQAITFWQSLAVVILARILFNANPLGLNVEDE